jgi:hypothetical protein
MDVVIAGLAGNIAAGERPPVSGADAAWWRELLAAAAAASCVGLGIGMLYVWLASMPVVEMRI